MKPAFGRRVLRGYAFSLDAAFAAAFVAAFLLMMHGYSIGSPAVWTDVNTLRLGSDIVDALCRNGTLQTLEEDAIEKGLNSLLPFNLNMSMKIYAYGASGGSAQCPQTLRDFDMIGCYDYTGTSPCWSGSKAGFVTYPPAGNCYTGPPSEKYGGLNLVPGLDSSLVELWCDDIYGSGSACSSDCDFNDVVAIFLIEKVPGGVKVSLSRDSRWSAGHQDSIMVSGTFGSQHVGLEVYNQGGTDYAEASISCGGTPDETTPDEIIQVNEDIMDQYYLGKSRFLTLSGAQASKFALVEYKVWFK